MAKIMCVVGGVVAVLFLLCAMPVVAAEAAMPTAEQYSQVAENPALLADLIKDATDEQAVDIMLKVIAQVDTLKIGVEAKQNRVSELFTKLVDVKGTIKGNEIIARIVKKVNPRLLPVVRNGGSQGAAGAPPPTAPQYKRQ